MPGNKRVRQLGADVRVTALDDGYDDLPLAVVVNIDRAGATALSQSSSDGLLHPVFNAYLIEISGRRLLIDAGAWGRTPERCSRTSQKLGSLRPM